MKKKILFFRALPEFLFRCFSFSGHYSKNGQYVKVKLFFLFSFVGFSLCAQHSQFTSNGPMVIPAGIIASNNADDLERHRVWLNMANPQGAFKQLLIGYIEGATNAHDNMFDGETQDANPYLDFYSMINDRKYVIQGRALPFSDTDLVPLGYRSALVSYFTISIDQVDGNLINQDIYIHDKVTGVTHNLKTGGYKFYTVIGTFDDRFILRYTNNTLGTDNFKNTDKKVFISVKNKIITINAIDNLINEIDVYDITGKEIYKRSNLNDAVFQIENLEFQNQILLVRVILENNNITTQKIVF